MRALLVYLALFFSSTLMADVLEYVRTGNLEAIHQSKMTDLEFDQRDNLGRNALHLALNLKQINIARYLIESEVGLEVKDHLGRTPFMLALTNKEGADLIELFIGKKASATHIDIRGRGINWYANVLRNVQIQSKIEEYKDSFKLPKTDDVNDLKNAINQGNIDELKKFVKKFGSLDFELEVGLPTVQYCIQNDLFSKVSLRELQILGADIHKLTISGDNPLNFAIKNKRESAIRQLLEVRARPDVKDAQERTAAMNAIVAKISVEVIDALLKATIELNHQDKAGQTITHLAILSQDNAIFEKVLGYAPDFEIPNKQGETPLILAASNGKVDYVLALLKAGANPNGVDASANDAAMLIARTSPDNYLKVKGAMRQNGYIVGQRNNNGETSDDIYRVHRSPNAPTTDYDPSSLGADTLQDFESTDENFGEAQVIDERNELIIPDGEDLESNEQLMGPDRLDEKLKEIVANFVKSEASELSSQAQKIYMDLLAQDDEEYNQLVKRRTKIEKSLLLDKDQLSQLTAAISEAGREWKLHQSKLSHFEAQHQSISSKWSSYTQSMQSGANNFIKKVTELGKRLSEYNLHKTNLENIIKRYENNEAQLSIEKLEITRRLELERTRKEQLVALARQRYQTDVERFNHELKVYRDQLNNISHRVRELEQNLRHFVDSFKKHELRGKYFVPITVNNKVDELLRKGQLLQALEYISQIERDYSNVPSNDASTIQNLNYQAERMFLDLKSFHEEKNNSNQSFSKKNHEIQQKISQSQRKRDRDVADAQNKFENSQFELKEELEIITSEIQQRYQEIKYEIEELNAEISRDVGPIAQLDEAWTRVRGFAQLLSGEGLGFKDAVVCINIPVTLCFANPQFLSAEALNAFRPNYQDAFNMAINKISTARTGQYSLEFELSAIEAHVDQLKGLVTSFHEKVQTSEALVVKIEENKEQLEQVSGALQSKIEEINSSGENQAALDKLTKTLRKIRLEENLLKGAYTDPLSWQDLKPYWLSELEILKGQGTFEQIKDLKKHIEDKYPLHFAAQTLAPTIFDFEGVKVKRLEGTEKLAVLSGYFDLLLKNWPFPNSFETETVQRNIFVHALNQLAEVEKFERESEYGLAFTIEGQRLIVDSDGLLAPPNNDEIFNFPILSEGQVGDDYRNYQRFLKDNFMDRYSELNLQEKFALNYMLNLLKKGDKLYAATRIEEVYKMSTLVVESLLISSGAGALTMAFFQMPGCARSVYKLFNGETYHSPANTLMSCFSVAYSQISILSGLFKRIKEKIGIVTGQKRALLESFLEASLGMYESDTYEKIFETSVTIVIRKKRSMLKGLLEYTQNFSAIKTSKLRQAVTLNSEVVIPKDTIVVDLVATKDLEVFKWKIAELETISFYPLKSFGGITGHLKETFIWAKNLNSSTIIEENFHMLKKGSKLILVEGKDGDISLLEQR